MAASKVGDLGTDAGAHYKTGGDMNQVNRRLAEATLQACLDARKGCNKPDDLDAAIAVLARELGEEVDGNGLVDEVVDAVTA